MAKEDLIELSLDEIKNRLSSLADDRQALEKALEHKRQQTKKDLAAEIKELIQSRGHDVAEIADLLGVKKRAGAQRKANRSYSRYVDPKNPDNVYVRGVLPGWMKEQMAAKGLDAKNKDDRETFKAKHLNKTEG